MVEQQKKEIMEQSRHLFIYGKNGIERETLLRSLEDDYPIKIDENSPMAIYMNSFLLPALKESVKTYDRFLVNNSVSEHFSFAVAENILEKMRKDIAKELIRERIEILLNMINTNFLNKGHDQIMSLEELIQVCKQAKEFYKNCYIAELTGENNKLNIDELRIYFIELNSFIRYLKEMLQNESYFGIIIDHQEPFREETCKTINCFVGRRSNSDISMKVAIEPEEWETYYDSCGNYIDAIHDYGTVELDDSLKQYTLKKKEEFNTRIMKGIE